MRDEKVILVTGGAGFIGGNFVLRLAREPRTKIINLDALTYAGNLDTLGSLSGNPNHVFVQGDIGNAALVAKLLAEHQPDSVVNFAAESHVDRSIDAPDPFVQTNVVGTHTLLKTALGYWHSLQGSRRERFRFLHVSTDEVFGSLGAEGLFTEQTPYAPSSPYAASKAAADHLVRAYHHTYGLPGVTTNCSNNYGPYQFPEKLIPLIILRALKGESLPVYGDGQNIRDWLYVGDHCEAIRIVLEKGAPGATYNVGAASEKTNLEVVHAVCGILDEIRPAAAPRASLISFVQDRPGHDRRYAIDAGKIRTELGWLPAETFVTGLRKTVQWYLDNSSWVERVLAGTYRLERLGMQSVVS